MIKRKYKRTSFFIYPQFQIPFAVTTTIGSIMASLSLYAMLALEVPLWVAGSVVILWSVLFSIYLSHRVAGPLYRFKKYLHDWQVDDKMMALKFRKGDYFQELAQEFNEFLQKTNGL